MTSRRLRGPRLFTPDAVVAVPLGPRRRRQRGYNQSEVLAAVIAEDRDVPVMDDLGRIRDTPPQSARDEATRRGNVAGAFAWTGADLARRVRLARRRRAHHGRHGRGGGGVLARAGASLIDVLVVAAVS